MQSLQAITDTFGKYLAQHLKCNLNWTASTDFSGHHELEGKTPVAHIAQTIVYGQEQLSSKTQKTYNALTYKNGTTIEQNEQYTTSATYDESMTWSITAAAEIGIEVQTSASFPTVASASQSITAKLSLSTTAQQSFDTSSTWSVTSSINVPANSIVIAAMQVQCGNELIPFTAPVLLTGSVAIMLDHGHGKTELRFLLIALLLNAVNQQNLIDTTGYSVYDPNAAAGVLVNVTGTYTAGLGLSRSVLVQQYPFSPDGLPQGTPTTTWLH